MLLENDGYIFPENERGIFWYEKHGQKVRNVRNEEIEALFDIASEYNGFEMVYEGSNVVESALLIHLVETEPDYFKRQKLVAEHMKNRKRGGGIEGLHIEVKRKAAELERKSNYLFSRYDFESFIYMRLNKAFDNRVNAINEGKNPPTRFFVQTLNNAYRWAEHDVRREIGGFEYVKDKTSGNYIERVTDKKVNDGYKIQAEAIPFDQLHNVGKEQEFEEEEEEVSVFSVLESHGKTKPIDKELLFAILDNTESFNLSEVARNLGITRQEARSSVARLRKAFGSLFEEK